MQIFIFKLVTFYYKTFLMSQSVTKPKPEVHGSQRWMYSYEGYIQPKYCKCCMQEKVAFRLPWQLIKFSSLD